MNGPKHFFVCFNKAWIFICGEPFQIFVQPFLPQGITERVNCKQYICCRFFLVSVIVDPKLFLEPTFAFIFMAFGRPPYTKRLTEEV